MTLSKAVSSTANWIPNLSFPEIFLYELYMFTNMVAGCGNSAVVDMSVGSYLFFYSRMGIACGKCALA